MWWKTHCSTYSWCKFLYSKHDSHGCISHRFILTVITQEATFRRTDSYIWNIIWKKLNKTDTQSTYHHWCQDMDHPHICIYTIENDLREKKKTVRFRCSPFAKMKVCQLSEQMCNHWISVQPVNQIACLTKHENVFKLLCRINKKEHCSSVCTRFRFLIKDSTHFSLMCER